jgi:hypothetical protein
VDGEQEEQQASAHASQTSSHGFLSDGVNSVVPEPGRFLISTCSLSQVRRLPHPRAGENCGEPWTGYSNEFLMAAILSAGKFGR